MVTVERLYGACHGIDLSFGFWKFPVNLKHSKQMLDELAALPKGTRVGIESVSDADREKLVRHFRKKKATLEFHAPSEIYWRTLVEYCKSAGLEVVHLETLDAHIETAEKFADLHKIQRKVDNGAQLHEKMYVAEAIAERYFAFAREPGMIERIMQSSPWAVVVGRAHADYFWTHQAQIGVSFGSYGAEHNKQDFHELLPVLRMLASSGGSDGYIAERLGGHVEPNTLVPDGVEASVLLDRELTERRYRAATGQRLTSETPAFHGTWDLHIPAQGKFEIFPGNGGIAGREEDVLGTATLDGNITLSNVSFIKRYDPERSSPKALCGEISYEGMWIGDRYRGNFSHPRASGSFELWPMPGVRSKAARRP